VGRLVERMAKDRWLELQTKGEKGRRKTNEVLEKRF
jgi:hypothetical protein